LHSAAAKPENFVQGLGFGVALLLGMVPTLAANAINAGSPFSTTYGGADAWRRNGFRGGTVVSGGPAISAAFDCDRMDRADVAARGETKSPSSYRQTSPSTSSSL